jgi:uncharacterized RDD family membrane protein YckC
MHFFIILEKGEKQMETENISSKIAGFWQRVGMRLLDLIIAGIPCVLLYSYSLKLSLGKLIMKARIIDKNGARLTILGSIGRIIFYIIGAACLISILNLAIQSQIEEKDVVHFISNSSSIYQTIYSYFSILVVVSDLLVLFNPKRRALHDFIAGSWLLEENKY